MNDQKRSSGLPSVTGAKGLLQITEVALLVRNSRLAIRLKLRVVPKKFTVHKINSHQVVNKEMVELKLTQGNSCDSSVPFSIKP